MKNIIIGLLIAVIILLGYFIFKAKTNITTITENYKQQVIKTDAEWEKKIEAKDKKIEKMKLTASEGEAKLNTLSSKSKGQEGRIKALLRQLTRTEPSEVLTQLQREFTLVIETHNLFRMQCEQTIEILKKIITETEEKVVFANFNNEENVKNALEALRLADKEITKEKRKKWYVAGAGIFLLILFAVAK